jgi:N-acetylmuramoyl-L-alanine amidase
MKIKLCALAILLVLSLMLPSCGMLRTATVVTTAPETTAPAESTAAVSETEAESIAVKPSVPTKNPSDPLTVCIDAGHGFTDPGCTSDYLGGKYERELTADYAEILKEKLEAEGVRVIMLRDDSNFIDAETVADGAAKAGVEVLDSKLVSGGRFAPYNRAVWTNVLHHETYIDLFISLHIDSYEEDENVKGTRVYYCTDTVNAVQSKRLCDNVAETVKTALPDTEARSFPKGAEEAYVVIKHTEMPSVLVEMGFATNKSDAENILSEDWREDFCTALANGITKYAG